MAPRPSCSSTRTTKTNFSTTSTRPRSTASPSEATRTTRRRTAIIQFTQPRTAPRRSSHTISVTMLGMRSSTQTHRSNHGRHRRRKACHSPTPMHSGLSAQFIQLRTAPPKSCHTTSATMRGTPSSTTTRPRSRGRRRLQKACHWLAPTPSTPRLQFIQPKIASLRFFHTTNVITHGMMSSILTRPRNPGRPQRQPVCHWPALLLSTLDRSTQPRIANLRSFLIISATTHGTTSNITTPPRNHGMHLRQTACLSPVPSPSHKLSRKRVNFNS
jgi:hypothetical protein